MRYAVQSANAYVYVDGVGAKKVWVWKVALLAGAYLSAILRLRLRFPFKFRYHKLLGHSTN